MMRRWIACGVALAIVLLAVPAIGAQAAKPTVSAKSAVLIDGLSGQILYDYNAHEQRAMASTTKIMTTLLAVESGRMEEELVTTREMVMVEGSSMGLKVGDTVSLETLCYGMLMASGNDAANTTALYLGGTQQGFARMMNQRAKDIGMTSTNFVTPSGLDDDQHYSTAYDMALLGRAAMQNPLFATMVSRKSVRVSFGNPPYERTLTGHNKLLNMYEHACGIKTGFTKKAGRCLVTAAKKDGALLIAVTLSAPDDWNDHIKLYEYGFSQMERVPLTYNTKDLRVPVTGGQVPETKVLCNQITVCLPKSRAGEITAQVQLEHFLYAPVAFGQPVGKVIYTLDGAQIGSSLLIASGDVVQAQKEEKQPGFWQRVLDWFKALGGDS